MFQPLTLTLYRTIALFRGLTPILFFPVGFSCVSSFVLSHFLAHARRNIAVRHVPARRIFLTLTLIVRYVAIIPYIGIYLILQKVRSHRQFLLCSAILLPFLHQYNFWYIHMPN